MNRVRRCTASRLSVVSSTSRLKSNNRAISSRRATASSVRARATDDRLLATRLTARNTSSATQFWGSAIVKRPTGGRKKKLKQRTDSADVKIAVVRLDTAAAISTIRRYDSAAIVGFVTESRT